MITIISRPIKTNQEEPRNTRDQGVCNAMHTAGIAHSELLMAHRIHRLRLFHVMHHLIHPQISALECKHSDH